MATPPAIEVSHVIKRFRLGVAQSQVGFPTYRTLRDSLKDMALWPLRQVGLMATPPPPPMFEALADVSLSIQPGEVVGLVGRNGAGKSTLLKILSRISRPSEGEVRMRGRVGSLLEVGTSFHPELTGRENIFLNGAILGMSRHEIRRKFDEIVEFSEVARFLDVPVKRYSSGMFIRLAFGVAAHLECDVLLIDEVLAVGDAAFQKKCLGHMSGPGLSGRTVFFVSHNMAALQSLCTRAIWLDRGRVVQDGPVADVVGAYLRTSFAPSRARSWATLADAPGNDEVRIKSARVLAPGGVTEGRLNIRTPLQFEIEFWNLKPGSALAVVFHLCNEQGTIVFRTVSIRDPNWHGKAFPRGLFRSVCEVPGDLLNDGTHFLEVLFRQNEGLIVYQNDQLLTIDIEDDAERRGSCHGDWPGAVRPDLAWRTEFLEPLS